LKREEIGVRKEFPAALTAAIIKCRYIRHDQGGRADAFEPVRDDYADTVGVAKRRKKIRVRNGRAAPRDLKIGILYCAAAMYDRPTRMRTGTSPWHFTAVCKPTGP